MRWVQSECWSRTMVRRCSCGSETAVAGREGQLAMSSSVPDVMAASRGRLLIVAPGYHGSRVQSDLDSPARGASIARLERAERHTPPRGGDGARPRDPARHRHRSELGEPGRRPLRHRPDHPLRRLGPPGARRRRGARLRARALHRAQGLEEDGHLHPVHRGRRRAGRRGRGPAAAARRAGADGRHRRRRHGRHLERRGDVLEPGRAYRAPRLPVPDPAHHPEHGLGTDRDPLRRARSELRHHQRVRLGRARDRRGAHVYAELVGYGATCDAYHMTQPAPEGAGAAECMRHALDDAGIEPGAIGYINAHGTGTPFNDEAETLAVKRVFGAHAARLPISSTKSMTGHLLGAAGTIEAAYTVLALARGVLPPTINLEEPDKACDLDYVAREARPARIDAALSNSFGFGGTNAVLAFRRADT